MPLLELPTIGPSRDRTVLLDALLAEQQELTVVERFAKRHEAGLDAGPAHEPLYRDLLPLTAPQPGEQYAFTVDLDACSGCKACVVACHSLNGLDDDEAFRDVGGFTGRETGGLHVLQHVTTACHHCLEPACLHGCPTRAYDKDPVTGIVRHLDDQCIGCQYCTLMCPYDVPKYNPARGIVRKCDMCRQRLSEGEAPACVQACPSQAIRIELVRHEDIVARAAAGEFLPTAPDPCMTLPTTRFVSKRRPLRDVTPANDHDRPAHTHLPLVFMLVLTQMSVGMFCVAAVGPWTGGNPTAIACVAAAVALLGQAAAVLHLGRPTIAWKAWLGWRTSWLSREIMAFGVFSGIAGAYVLSVFLYGRQDARLTWLGVATSFAGLAGVLCSAMIYAATRREFWSAARTIPRFFITAALLGLVGAITTDAIAANTLPKPLLVALLAFTFCRLIADTSIFRFRDAQDESPLRRSAELLTGPLRGWNESQAAAAAIGGILLPGILLYIDQPPAVLAVVACGLLIAAELVQRGLFFAAVAPPRMPGVNHA